MKLNNSLDLARDKKGITLIVIILITAVVSLAVAGGGVWYWQDQQAQKQKEESDKKVAELQKQVDDSKKQIEDLKKSEKELTESQDNNQNINKDKTEITERMKSFLGVRNLTAETMDKHLERAYLTSDLQKRYDSDTTFQNSLGFPPAHPATFTSTANFQKVNDGYSFELNYYQTYSNPANPDEGTQKVDHTDRISVKKINNSWFVSSFANTK